MLASQVISSRATFITCSFIESVAYGVAAVLFVESVLALLRTRRRRDSINIPLIVVAPLIFLFATIHMCGVWYRSFVGFVTYPEGPDAYWALITTPEKTITQVGQLGAITLGDAMTVYRAWMIWERNLAIIVVPLLTFFSTCVSGVAFVTIQHKVDVHTSIFQATVTKWTEAWLASSLCTTGICTGLVVWRLTSLHWRLRDSYNPSDSQATQTQSLTSRVIRIVIESAALYSVVNLLYCVLYAAALNPEAWFSTLDAPTASITFSLIIVRTEIAARPRISTYSTSRIARSWGSPMNPIPLGRMQEGTQHWMHSESSSSAHVDPGAVKGVPVAPPSSESIAC